MSRPTPPTYKTRNWPAHNEALKRRGSLTVWFDPAMTWDAAPTGKRGRQPDYSDAAIQTCLTVKVLFGMALRQTTGFVESLLRLIGLDWVVSDFSTLSRRQKTLKVNIPYRGSDGPLHLLVDSTGIKVEGEGEWNSAGAVASRLFERPASSANRQTILLACHFVPCRTAAITSPQMVGSPVTHLQSADGMPRRCQSCAVLARSQCVRRPNSKAPASCRPLMKA